MTRYAEHTTVSIAKSREEIERTLARFKATGDAWVRDDEKRIVHMMFKRGSHAYRFTVRLAVAASFKRNKSNYQYFDAPLKYQEEHADQENRRLFRSLANYIKAILDAVDSGILTFDEAMSPHLMLPGGGTVSEAVIGQLPALAAGGVLNLSIAALPKARQ